MSVVSSNPVAQTAGAVEGDDLFGPLVLQLARSRFAAQGAGVTTWDTVGDAERKLHADAARQILQEILGAGYKITLPKDTVRDDPSASSPGLKLEGVIPQACHAQAERFLRSGEPLLAYNAVQEGLEKWPTDLRLRQLQSLALARSGAVARANQGLQKLRDEGYTDGETIGMLARTHKDLGMRGGQPRGRRVHLEAAFDLYDEAYRRALHRGLGPGLLHRHQRRDAGAAARRARDGARDRARGAAALPGRRAREEGRQRLLDPGDARRGRADPGRALGGRGAVRGARRRGAAAATATSPRRASQARLLAAHQHRRRTTRRSRACCGSRRCWCSRGHMVDRGRNGGLPAALEAAVRDAIRARVEALRRWRPTAPRPAAPTSCASRPRATSAPRRTWRCRSRRPSSASRASTSRRAGASASTGCWRPPTASSSTSDHRDQGQPRRLRVRQPGPDRRGPVARRGARHRASSGSPSGTARPRADAAARATWSRCGASVRSRSSTWT